MVELERRRHYQGNHRRQRQRLGITGRQNLNNFRLLASGIDVAPLLAELDDNPQLWDEITLRQGYEGSAHRDTKAIFLRWCSDLSVKSAFLSKEAVDYPALAKLPAARPFLKDGRALVVNLRAGGRVTPHIDQGLYSEEFMRTHLVLSARPGVLFHSGGETVEMRTGELWWFNHRTTHSVENNSGADRLHLIIDTR